MTYVLFGYFDIPCDTFWSDINVHIIIQIL